MNNVWKMVAAFLVVGAVGCSATDPCDGLSGTCISAKVTGSVGDLDQLRINVKGFASKYTPNPAAGTFSLPVKLALSLPASVGNMPVVSIDGLKAGVVVGSSTEDTLTVTAGTKQSHEFKLMAGPGSDGGVSDSGVDLSVNYDLSGPFVITPTSLNFGDVPRGTTSAPQTVMAINHTSQTVIIVGGTVDGGAEDDVDFPSTFDMTAGSGCTIPDMGKNLAVLPNSTCNISFTFAPFTLGPKHNQVYLSYTVAGTPMVTILDHVGNATPSWSDESLTAGNTLEAVWGHSATDVFVVGHDQTTPIWHSKGDGNWGALGNGTTENLYAVGGLASNGSNSVLFVGGAPEIPDGGVTGPSGIEVFHTIDSGNTFKPDPIMGGAIGRVVGLASMPNSTTEAYAVTDMARLLAWDPTTVKWYQDSDLSTNTSRLTALAVQQGLQVFVGSGFVGYRSGAGLTPSPASLPSVATTYTGVWIGKNVVWATDTNGDILRWDDITTRAAPVVEHAVSGVTLNGIAGRVLTNGDVDIWAVGTLGNSILHRNATGTWDQVPIATTARLYGVWVADNGEVFAVGDKGAISHLH